MREVKRQEAWLLCNVWQGMWYLIHHKSFSNVRCRACPGGAELSQIQLKLTPCTKSPFVFLCKREIMFNAFTSSYNTWVSQTKRGVCTASDKILLCVIVRVDLLYRSVWVFNAISGVVFIFNLKVKLFPVQGNLFEGFCFTECPITCGTSRFFVKPWS